jgi:hypothetical protein
LYTSGYAFVGLAEFSFEIDDEGNHSGLWQNTRRKLVLVEWCSWYFVNAQTGEIKEHSIVTTPSWVDRIQPIYRRALNDWGIMYMDIEFSNANKLQITEGLTLVYGNDNKSYWYTGLTSVGRMNLLWVSFSWY